jgi:SAM-dependent methyltransferase
MGKCEQPGRAAAAEMYQRYVVPFLVGPWTPGLVELAALQPGERVLDVACGTGVAARLAAQQVGASGKVTGLDTGPGMLAVAGALPPPPGATITWVECGAEAMRLTNSTYDVALCQQGLQFFSDKSAALREMHRVLRPGGRLVLSVWKKPNPYSAAMRAAVARHISLEAAARLEISTCLGNAEELRGLLVDAGFRHVLICSHAMTIRLPRVEEFVLRQMASMPIADAVAALDEKTRAALAEEVRMALRCYAAGDGVAFSNEINLATARA